MGSSDGSAKRIVNDNIHGDITLSEIEWKVVNTATFQRLRSLKQLGMGHLVYPNATHTRFAHSIGVFRIMCRVLDNLAHPDLGDEQRSDLRLAALLHDIGHYPYSHLMERVGYVTLTEEVVESDVTRTISGKTSSFPDHEEVGRLILSKQSDIKKALGGPARAKKIGALFSRLESTDQQLSKLIHSSLDMDRMDYLIRDARASGVPYGEIDINYLLNNIMISPKGMLGVREKAIAAAEHFLLARVFMHRAVYYHKTTFGFEEACRQLLRRIQDSGRYEALFATDGERIKRICSGSELRAFNDDYVDRVIYEALTDSDPIIKGLATCLSSRRPPHLLCEVSGLEKKGTKYTARSVFRQRCRTHLPDLARSHRVRLEQFLLCGPKPIKFEERGSLLSKADIESLKAEEREELIMVFRRHEKEPKSIVDIDGSIISSLSNEEFGIQRLYFVDIGDNPEKVDKIRNEVLEWTKPPR